jgi:transcriptional regulator with XRE-family HTH domain
MDLAEFRKARGLNQDQLAEALGLTSKAYISQLETGAVPVPMRLALQIEEWSGGAVRAVDLLSPDDARLLRAAMERAPAIPAPAGA